MIRTLSRTAVALVLIAIVLVVVVVVGTIWQVIQVTDANAQRLAAQGQLLVAGLGFAVAVVVAVVTSWYAWLTRGLLLEARADRKQREFLTEAEQARLVGAFLELRSLPSSEVAHLRLRLTNASPLPVRRVRGRVFNGDSLVPSLEFDNVPVLTPGDGHVDAMHSGPGLEVAPMRLVLEFDDDNGVRWRKYDKPPLVKVGPP